MVQRRLELAGLLRAAWWYTANSFFGWSRRKIPFACRRGETGVRTGTGGSKTTKGGSKLTPPGEEVNPTQR